ncbi:heparinase II/III domain-containing protein [Aestuariivivens insulae]|uniref:heparinase II/III domain-containing protein n=1 Tax=Aestuariivivens insulae TaxID=1621988 RepID=UPI001F572F03|nr:heparinase II/III family protein [Aestuariivivens insulae]
MLGYFKTMMCGVLLFQWIIGSAQKTERPFIWVSQSDREEILNEIETQDWARSFFKGFKERLDSSIVLHKTSPYKFLKELPFNWSIQKKEGVPPFKTITKFDGTTAKDRYNLNTYLQVGIDSGVMYYLTNEKRYAQCALDVLYNFIEALVQMKPSIQRGNGGWVYPNDHLREARVIGAQLPIIYDFIGSFLEKNKKAYSVGAKDYRMFSVENAQKVFLTYAKLAVEHGHTGSNWSVLESYSLVQNALALNDLKLRQQYLNYYLVDGTDTQDALPDIGAKYKKEGDVFPETSQYSNGVASYTTTLMYMLNKYQPDLRLGKKYYNIPLALDRWNALRFPNKEIIRFGDGHRKFRTSYVSYDMAYLLGQQDSVDKLKDKYGPLLSKGIVEGSYDRGAVGRRSMSVTVYTTPLRLLWIRKTKDYKYGPFKEPRTDKFTHAGVYLQRNLSATQDPNYGLMCFVGGAHMVHGHASGMDMELYGVGEVLGVDHGRGKYRTNLHENYSRLFAAHNSVIVNGASQGEGGWVNLGMNSTQLVAMEPKPKEKAVSPNYSFTRTHFVDDKGDKAEAVQDRTMALVRTSPTTGYYVDVFRSKSSLPNEYHDYLYHNIGDQVTFLNDDLDLNPDENRFKANANAEHLYNKKFRNPGWHFFEDVKSSGIYEKNVNATFKISRLLDGKDRSMHVFITGDSNREYTVVNAPITFEAPVPYNRKPTPTIVIRQKGEAWTQPFAVVYEPSLSKTHQEGIQAVSKLESNGNFKGIEVVSKINSKKLTQVIISQESNALYENKERDIEFIGAFAIITFDNNNNLLDVYMGQGTQLRVKDVSFKSKGKSPGSVFVDFKEEIPRIVSSNNAEVKLK